MLEDHICFSLRRRISRVIICLVQPLRVPRFPKQSLFLRTMPSTHFTQTTYFGWCRYFSHHFAALSLYHQWLQQTSLHLMQQFFSLDQAVFKACFKKVVINPWLRLRKFPIVFQPIIIKNFDVQFTPVLHFSHWYYTFLHCVTLELHCSQPIWIEFSFHVFYQMWYMTAHYRYIFDHPQAQIFSADIVNNYLFMEKKYIADCHCAWVLCWEAINHSPVCDFIKKKPPVFEHRASTIKLCTLYAGLQWFQKLA